MGTRIQVAIDGPVSSGKTTVGKKVAMLLNYAFVDTGLMYRAVAWKSLKENAREEEWGKIAAGLMLTLRGDPASPRVCEREEDITEALTSPEVSQMSSRVAANSEVRKALVAVQRGLAARGGVVMVGRDIGTVVLPEAPVKIFLTASVDERARRRYEELLGKGANTSLQEVRAELIERDLRDEGRSDSPLVAAPDAIQVDCTHVSADEVAEKIVALARVRGG